MGGESFQKTTGSDVCGLFSLLESSYLGPSVGGELRCVKWEEEKPFYWPINQMCVCVWVGGTIVDTPTGENDEDETLKRVFWWRHAPVYDLS